jgi:hypothetical protein
VYAEISEAKKGNTTFPTLKKETDAETALQQGHVKTSEQGGLLVQDKS